MVDQLIGGVLGLAVGSLALVLIFRPWRDIPRWEVLEDWTRGKYPDYHGGVRTFTHCFTQRGAKRKARRLNRQFTRAGAINVYFRVGSQTYKGDAAALVSKLPYPTRRA